jgi:hypothetical protein
VFSSCSRGAHLQQKHVVGGVIHMLIATPFVVAPVRSFFDPNYLGFGFGLLRFDGQAATLPSLVILTWAVASAWLIVAQGRGRSMWCVAAFDLFVALNSAATTLVARSDNQIQFGNALTIGGIWAALIMLALFTFAPLVSSAWAMRRVQFST